MFSACPCVRLSADSSKRATVLSVKGLAWNLGYGGLALVYAGVLGWFESEEGSPGAALPGQMAALPAELLKTMSWMRISKR